MGNHAHNDQNQEDKSRAAADLTGKKNSTQQTSQLQELINNSEQVSQLKAIQQLANESVQRKTVDVTIAKNEPAGDSKNVVQKANVYANQAADGTTYRWRSRATFDTNHYSGATPDSDQGWIDWRLGRWPGFAATLPGATLITGDLSAALLAGNYEFEEQADGYFDIYVNVACTTINPRNVGNALTINNLQRTDYNHVKLGGYYSTEGNGQNQRDTCLINHLYNGYNVVVEEAAPAPAPDAAPAPAPDPAPDPAPAPGGDGAPG